ncbi:hypothetical protein Y1Q_0015895 [Alligator mississippiensis]|uniref:Uncharacterized protein n=1 Tax=Alligator mississippiensis TaxID=8496 RepID=A0A151MHC0_ALLMI|nr:hypothetical protein Y1Q_0015895 [Alligator mississippiensis]
MKETDQWPKPRGGQGALPGSELIQRQLNKRDYSGGRGESSGYEHRRAGVVGQMLLDTGRRKVDLQTGGHRCLEHPSEALNWSPGW